MKKLLLLALFCSVLLGNAFATATGGTITSYTSGGYNYTVHTFTTNGTFNSTGALNISVLVVAGGGGGRSGGGGAGGLYYNETIEVNGVNNITVGQGGAGATVDLATNACGGNGQNSTFNSITTVGGGGGANTGNSGNINGCDGGSGGGGGAWSAGTTLGGNGTTGQGFNGGGNAALGSPPYHAGGGGGAATNGTNAFGGVPGSGIGGNGSSYNISGNDTFYAGGGGGGTYQSFGVNPTGGFGGGGNGSSAAVAGGNGTDGLGGGGGGSGGGGIGGNGGRGVVIISYREILTNVPPTITSVAVTNSTPNQFTNLGCSANYTDPDNATLNLTFSWWVNGARNDSLNTSVSCSSGVLCYAPTNRTFPTLQVGQNWACSAMTNDGINVSNLLLTSNVTILRAQVNVSAAFPTPANNAVVYANYIAVNYTATSSNLTNITVRVYKNGVLFLNYTNTTTNYAFRNMTGLLPAVYTSNATACDNSSFCNESATSTYLLAPNAIGNCSGNLTIPIANFTLLDETLLTPVGGTMTLTTSSCLTSFPFCQSTTTNYLANATFFTVCANDTMARTVNFTAHYTSGASAYYRDYILTNANWNSTVSTYSLLYDTLARLVVMTVKNIAGSPIPGATINVYRVSNNSLISSVTTDTTGTTGAFLTANFVQYYFNITGAATLNQGPQVVTCDPYIASCQLNFVVGQVNGSSIPQPPPNVTDPYIGVSYVFTPYDGFQNQSFTIYWNISTNASNLEYYGMRVSRQYYNESNSSFCSSNGTNAAGGSLSCAVTGYGSYYAVAWFKQTGHSEITTPARVWFYQNQSFTGFQQAQHELTAHQPIGGSAWLVLTIILTAVVTGYMSRYTVSGAGLIGLAAFWFMSVLNNATIMTTGNNVQMNMFHAASFTTIAVVGALLYREYG